ncbi:MAG: CBS domain-containing protein [Bdellovibrionales bacterium]|nr:CBS domain-containing protein [Bdellovibrionales bacterium]
MSLPESEIAIQPLIKSADQSLPVWKFWKLMKLQKRKFLPLVDERGDLKGVVRGRDIATLTALSPGSLNINDVLDTTPFCVKLTDPISKLVKELTSKGGDYAVILDASNVVLEIVTVNQVLNFTNQALQSLDRAKVFDLFQWRLSSGDN